MQIEVTSSISFGRTEPKPNNKKEWFSFEEKITIQEQTNLPVCTPEYKELYKSLSVRANTLIKQRLNDRLKAYYNKNKCTTN